MWGEENDEDGGSKMEDLSSSPLVTTLEFTGITVGTILASFAI